MSVGRTNGPCLSNSLDTTTVGGKWFPSDMIRSHHHPPPLPPAPWGEYGQRWATSTSPELGL